jgi:hypothetical protein
MGTTPAEIAEIAEGLGEAGMQLEVVRKRALLHASPPGNGCRPVRSLSESGSGSGSESGSESIPVLNGTWPSWTAQTSLPSFVSTATIRLRYPVSHVRIPSPVPAIPIPIATPTPTSLRHLPFRIAPSYVGAASATPKNTPKGRDLSIEPTHTRDQVENATAPSAGGAPDPDGDDSRRDRRGRRGVWGGGNAASRRSSEKGRFLMRLLQAMVADQSDHCLNRGRGRNRDRNRFLF